MYISRAHPFLSYDGFSRAIYLKDLTMIDEGNPDLLQIQEKSLINFPKHLLTSKRIDSMMDHQNVSFRGTKREPIFTFLYELPGLPEDELYELSLEREPRAENTKPTK